jgi:beta-lactamase regulating signal transducer with metallopeptidase domain
MERGLLLAVPLDSVLLRVAIAVVVGAVLGHLLYRLTLRSARARFTAAFIPVVAATVTLFFSLGSPRMPVLMVPTSSGAVLPVPVEYGYLDFAPMTVPVLVTLWAVVALFLLARRAHSYLAFTSLRRSHNGRTIPADLKRLVEDTAAHMGIASPQILVLEHCHGGAYVAGIRRPCLVVSDTFYRDLDHDERAGMVAHELAHVARRDVVTALGAGVLKDILFFVPGRAWADRSLHRERERAADERAVAVTRKPAALASSMLKALALNESAPASSAALAPQGAFIGRIEALLEPRPVTRTRHRVELLTVGIVSIATVLAALSFPAVLRADGSQRDGVAVMWSNLSGNDPLRHTEARVFTAYRDVAASLGNTATQPVRTHIERQLDNRPSTMFSCTDSLCPSHASAVSLGLTPKRLASPVPPARVLRATPVRDDSGSSVRLFWVANPGGE